MHITAAHDNTNLTRVGLNNEQMIVKYIQYKEYDIGARPE